MSSSAAVVTPGLKQIEAVHLGLIETVHRICNGDNVVPISATRDFDGNDLLIHVNAIPKEDAPKKKLKEELDEDRTTAPKGKAHISVVHNVTLKTADTFGNLADCLEDRFGKLEEAGALQVLEKPNKGCTLTVEVDLQHEKYEEALAAASQLRVAILEAPFFGLFDAMAKNPAKAPNVVIPYRLDETLYLIPDAKSSKIDVITAIKATTQQDKTFLKNLLQSFQDAKQKTPNVNFKGTVPPANLPEDLIREPKKSQDYFWVTIALGGSVIAGPKKRSKAVLQVVNFRHFCAYHLACLRSQLHMRMRQRVESSLQVINRAKTASTGQSRVQIEN